MTVACGSVDPTESTPNPITPSDTQYQGTITGNPPSSMEAVYLTFNEGLVKDGTLLDVSSTDVFGCEPKYSSTEINLTIKKRFLISALKNAPVVVEQDQLKGSELQSYLPAKLSCEIQIFSSEGALVLRGMSGLVGVQEARANSDSTTTGVGNSFGSGGIKTK